MLSAEPCCARRHPALRANANRAHHSPLCLGLTGLAVPFAASL
jgi:hypothetical protein